MDSDFLLPLLWFVVVIAIIGGGVYGLIHVSRRRHGLAEVDPGIGTVRRFYFYVVSFVALMMAANGVVQIAVFVLDGLFDNAVVSADRTRLAIGLSLTIVGLPLWFIHWRIVQRKVEELPVETRSILRKVYIYVVLAVGATFVFGAAIQLVQFILRAEDFSSWPWAAIPVWGAIWLYHWRVENEEGQPTDETLGVRRIYLYLFTAVMLSVAVTGAAIVIHTILREAYESLASANLVSRSGLWSTGTTGAVASLIVGSAWWVAHWLYFARGDYDSTLRHLYVNVYAMLGGVITILVALGILIYNLLQWLIGVPDDNLARDHFRFLPAVVTSIAVGGGVLVYHWLVSEWERGLSAEQIGPRRAYPYVLAAIGLGPLAGGVVTLVILAVGILAAGADATIAGRDLWLNRLVIALTLGILGGPLWGYYWYRIQSRVNAGDLAERTSQPRRIFLYGVIGAGMLAFLGGATVLIFVFFGELLDGDMSEFLKDGKEAVGFLGVVAVFLPYYWGVLRTDRREAPEVEVEALPERKAVTALVTSGGEDFLLEIESALGYGVTPLLMSDPESKMPDPTEYTFQVLAERIAAAAGRNVLLIPEENTYRIVSYN